MTFTFVIEMYRNIDGIDHKYCNDSNNDNAGEFEAYITAQNVKVQSIVTCDS